MPRREFIPNTKIDVSEANEKRWAGEVGMLPYSETIVFTKESLILFLKTQDIMVDTNSTQLRKLPKFAQFGKLVPIQGAPEPTVAAPETTKEPAVADIPAQKQTGTPVIMPDGSEFVPSRRVRQQPGGGSAQIAALFGAGADDENEDEAPQERKVSTSKPSPFAPSADNSFASNAAANSSGEFKPTRKVREAPGGGSKQIAALFGGEE